jgi:hypothetical protein
MSLEAVKGKCSEGDVGCPVANTSWNDVRKQIFKNLVD